MIYLDNNATTPLHPEVREAMLPFLDNQFGNPSAGYRLGKQARRAVETAREQVAELIGARPEEMIFTSCGTESINAALHSALDTFPDRKRILTTAVEHSATMKPCQYWKRKGYEVTHAPVDEKGLLDLDAFEEGLQGGQTAVASVIWANNETGVISPVSDAARLAEEAGVLFHTDAIQAVGKIPVFVPDAPYHLLSLSGHKLHAPKGVGALYISREVRFCPLLFGGGQEHDRRSGTENVAGIVGLGKAAELARMELMEDQVDHLKALRNRLENGLREVVPDIEINGHSERRLPNTSNLYFPDVDGEALLVMLDEKGVCCSPGSACSTGAGHPSQVLQAMGHSKERAKRSIRISLSRFNTEAEIDEAVGVIQKAVERFRSVRPATAGPVRRSS